MAGGTDVLDDTAPAALAMPDLAYWGTVGDTEADPLVAGWACRPGVSQIATLLDHMMRWDPREEFPPPPGLDPAVHQAAKAFLEREDVLDDAFAGAAVDWARVERAQAGFQEFLMSGLMVLGCASLPACYVHPGVALILSGSGRLMVQVSRRLRETIDFLRVVMTPESLRKGGAGVRWIRKVRLMHALMRALTLADAAGFRHLAGGEKASDYLLALEWRKRFAQRTPIDQVELAYVLLTFSWLLVRGFDELGIERSAAQQDDHIYAWAVIGHGLGIGEALRPLERSAARRLFEQIRAEREQGTEEGRLLAGALIVFIVMAQREQVRLLLRDAAPWQQALIRWVEPLLDPFFQSQARTLVRKLAGIVPAEKLWVPRAPFIHWLVGVLLRAGMKAIEMRSGRAEKGLPRVLGKRFNELVERR